VTPEQIYIYTEEIYIHAQVGLSNYITFNNIVADPRSRQSREAWVFLQGFLSHFGMVSKLLYAPSARKQISKDRARELRDYLNITEEGALNNRDARNAVEHLDERLDNWLSEEGKGILECVFENRTGYDFLQRDKWTIRRVYLMDEHVFMTEGKDGPKEMSLEPIANELSRICQLCNEKLDGHNPYYMVMPNRG
jgi:hypothetical protein